MRARPLPVILLLFALLAPFAAAGQADSLFVRLDVDTTKTAPVVLGTDTLFHLRASLRNFDVHHRARILSARIEQFAGNYGIALDRLRVAEGEGVVELLMGDDLLLAVYDIEAEVEGTTRGELMQVRLAALRRGVETYRHERSRSTLVWAAVTSVLATALLLGLLWGMLRVRAWVARSFAARAERVTEQTRGVVQADWVRIAVRLVVRIAFWGAVVVLVYAWLEFVLTRFVWTRGFAHQLLALTLQPLGMLAQGFVDNLPNLLFLVVLYVITRLFLRFLHAVAVEVQSGRIVLPGFETEWAMPTYRIAAFLTVAFALVVAFPYIPGSSSPAFQGVSIFLGVLFSLGSTSAVANVVAGVIITYMRSYKAGDVVKIQDTAGLVVTRGLLVTRIRTPKNVEVTIPNSAILGGAVTNYSARAKDPGLVLHTSVTIGYDTPWRQVHALLRMAAEKTEGVKADPPPFVLQKSLDDFYVTYELNAYTAEPERMNRIYSALHRNIQDVFNEYGVQIMSPNYEADRAGPTVVPKEKWYAAPADPAKEE